MTLLSSKTLTTRRSEGLCKRDKRQGRVGVEDNPGTMRFPSQKGLTVAPSSRLECIFRTSGRWQREAL
ncbi:hypothetical protein Hamer_G024197 [Homarus americanus]|uniref:Uncharacterized protein n=1 Tax=Homarus americanus TaxID=6706 RepID=A0A8J5JTJ6_HOMAM|nr:hypothetical protein Hamer_G024197 [Homarus americanus]